MRFLDPLLFLIGHRGAIERIAATRHAWIVGAILVLSAGIARNYDHLDLLREPEWFVGPFAASMVSIWFIFSCIKGPLKLVLAGPEGKQLGAFLTFAWMTAPCAWLYGIPVEAMTDIVTATKWNIAFLGIVSLWRVALMTRAVVVLTGVTHLRAFVLVLAPAAFEAMIGSVWKGMSLVQIMGGVRLPPHSEMLRDATGFVSGASFWIFVAAVAACWIVKGRAVRPLCREASASGRHGIGTAVVSLALWIALALPFQPEVANKHRLEALVKSRDFPAAVEFAMSKSREEFPRIHHLPPEPAGWFPLDLLDALPPDAPDWLRDEWYENAAASLVMRFTISDERWRSLKARHPAVLNAVSLHAELLRNQAEIGAKDRWWLGHYDRAAGNNRPAVKNPRFHPEQIPLPGE